jgi:predicted metalloprotease
MTTRRHFRVFLSSPGDVSEERVLARKIIKDELPYDPFLRGATLEIVSWDDPSSPTPMLASLTPQDAIDRGLPKPSECDFVVVILWGRFGTPLPDSVRKPNGERYLSGTEWEYEDAISAKRRPEILIYRRTGKVLLDADDPELPLKLEQRKRVKEFFDRFGSADGSYTGGINIYDTPHLFAERLKNHLRTLLERKLATGKSPVAGSIARPFQRATKAFLNEYLVSETGKVPFGGRDRELERLDAWVRDEKAAPRMLVTAPAGRGKSALLVQWMKSLQDRGQVTADKWQLAFMPISIRVGTNRPSVFLGGLAHRLAEITGEPVAREAIENAEALKDVVQDQLEAIASKGQRVLIVLDGLDEALQGSFDASIMPTLLPGTLRILLSARWQVGDIDSTGWLRRLGWDRIRAEKFELERLTPEAIADVLLKLGAPTDVLARQRNIVERLAELTEGEPLLVRFYAEDLWQLGPRCARITISDLDDMRPGFGSYFERWLTYQERLWDDEGVNIPREEVDRVLSILAFALGPLESRDLLGLIKEIHQRDDFISEHRLLQPLRRFILGNGKPESGYVLSHPKIGEYLEGERFGGRAAALRRGFAEWGLHHLMDLNAARVEPQNASHYALQFLRGHFENAGRPATEWLEFVKDGWRRAWEQFEGVPRGFASDVQATWDRIRSSQATMIGNEWRCALVLSSIRSIGLSTPDGLLCAAVTHGLLSIRQASHFVDIGRSEAEAASLLLQLSQLDVLVSSVESNDLISTALEKACSCRNERSRAQALGSLAPQLSPEQIGEALAAAKAIGDEGYRAHALGSLAPQLSPEQIGEALAAAKAIGDERARAQALGSLAPQLSPEQIGEAFAAAKAIGDDWARADALGSLAPQLSPEQIGEALAAAKAIGDEGDRADALGSLAPQLSPEQIGEALAAAKAIGDERARAHALGSLAPQLSPEQKTETLGQALAAAKAIGDEGYRAHALGSLAPQLSPEQIGEALAAAKAIGDEWYRADALGSLAPQLSPEQKTETLGEALAAAKAIGNEGARAQALGSLAPQLSPEQIGEALAAAKAIGDERARAQALESLAPQLSPEHIGEALAAAKAIGDEWYRAHALGSLAPQLSPEQKAETLGEALAAAKAIGDDWARAQALESLAPQLSPEQKTETLGEALAAAKAIGDEGSRAQALGSLAPQLSPEQIGEALAAAKAIGNERARAQALGSLDPQLSPEQIGEALAAAKAIGNERARAQALGSLAPQLSPEQIGEALAAAKAIGNEGARAQALGSLAPQLSPEQKTETLGEALAAAKAIGDDWARAQALGSLAPQLSPEQLGEALAAAKAIGEYSIDRHGLAGLRVTHVQKYAGRGRSVVRERL